MEKKVTRLAYPVKTNHLKIPEGADLSREEKLSFTGFISHAFIQEQTKGDLRQCLCLLLHPGEGKIEDFIKRRKYDLYTENPYHEEFLMVYYKLFEQGLPLEFDENCLGEDSFHITLT